MKRLSGWLLVLAWVAAPVHARVVSYAAYSDRISRTAYHERNTRWFLTTEAVGNEHELVLYDSSEREEPRVIPLPNAHVTVAYAALYESKKTPAAAPVLLVNGFLSTDRGVTWQAKFKPGEYVQLPQAWELDTGGPFVRGLSSAILPGTDEVPFVLGDSWRRVWTVPLHGDAVVMEAEASLVGRNAAGTRFLIRKSNDIRVAGLDGYRDVVRGVPPDGGRYTGWLTADGSAYLLATTTAGRHLAFYPTGRREAQYVAGPVGLPQIFHSTLALFAPTTSFAVPTYDYEGAWIIQRSADTTLSRHTRAGGLQKMWSDPTRPEVEALIAGAAGNTLLVQVHREREVQDQEAPIRIDPALAVWRVGEPMPQEYDELYLHEGWDKGFVHVDVDRLASGEPFVFYSGEQPIEEEESDFSSSIGGGDILQEWGIVRGSLRQHLVLPGVARARGAFGSRWYTDVTLHNGLDEVQNVELRFVPMAEEQTATNARTLTLALAPHEIRVLEDVLEKFGVDDGGGTVHIVPDRVIDVHSRTYSRKADGGTFGFGMHALDLFVASGPRFPLTFAGAFAGANFRTNVLLTDTSGRGAEAELRAYHGATSVVADRTLQAPAGGTTQFNGVSLLPSGPLPASQQGGALMVRTKRGMTLPMVVAIDNRTNDATYLPPDLATGIERVIPAIGHLDGAQGARFRSDLYLFNASPYGSTVRMRAVPWRGAAGRTVSIALQGYESRTIPDALMTLFGMTGLAQVRVTNDQVRSVRVTSRTYNVDATGATSGCLIPPLNAFHIASEDERLEILTAVPTGFRTNLGLVRLGENVGGEEWVTLELFDESGTRLTGPDVIRIDEGGGRQINDLFAVFRVAVPRAVRVVITSHGEPVAAYVTLTDNLTNDTLYIPGQLGDQPR